LTGSSEKLAARRQGSAPGWLSRPCSAAAMRAASAAVAPQVLVGFPGAAVGDEQVVQAHLGDRFPADHVPAVGRDHRAADLAFGERGHQLLERGLHLVAAEDAQVATVALGGGIVRVAPRQVIQLAPAGAQEQGDAAGPLLGLGLGPLNPSGQSRTPFQATRMWLAAISSGMTARLASPTPAGRETLSV
jgi:hypothetical protein